MFVIKGNQWYYQVLYDYLGWGCYVVNFEYIIGRKYNFFGKFCFYYNMIG